MDETLSLVQGEIIYILENGSCFNFEQSYGRARGLFFQGEGERLYTCLRETLTEHLQSKPNSLVIVTKNDFLQTINKIWNRHKTSMAHISNILIDMDRVYVIENDVANVIDLGLQIFRDQIYRSSGIQEKLRDALLDLTRQARNGEEVNSLTIKNACQMLKDLGLGDRSIYNTDFELPFLKQTAEFYEVAILNYSTENSASSCFKNFKRRMTEEYERAILLVGDITAARVVAVFEQVLMKTLRDTLLDITIPQRKTAGLNSPCIDESEFDLPFVKKSAELYKSGIINLPTEKVVFKCTERVKYRLIQLYAQAKLYILNEATEARIVAKVEKEFIEKLRDTIIKTIMAERNGEVVDYLTTKNVLQILIILGMDDSSHYNKLVELSEDFYKKEIPICLAENSALKCIEMLKQQTIAVSKWAKCYLDENTEAETVANIEAEWKKQMRVNVEMKTSGITQSLKCRKSEGLGCMYKQFSTCNQDSLISQSDVHEPQEDVAENCAITFIQNLLDLKQRVVHCSVNRFQNDDISNRIFKAVHDFGFLQLMNGNPSIPEYLALFIDDKLKNFEISEQENDASLNETIFLFKFLLEKDLFEYYHRKKLAKRLLLNKTISDANEKNVISKLKVECGHQFTANLEGMIQDIAISVTQMKEFREHIINHGVSLNGVDLNVRVLTTRFWPILSVTPFCAIPDAPLKAFQSFMSFYLTKHHGRKLILKPQLGSAELSAVFLKPTREEREGDDEVLPSTSEVNQLTSLRNNGPRKYTIVVSTYQMCILLLFNNRTKLTYDEIKNETRIPDEDLIRALQSLAMGKASQRILIKHPKTKETESSPVFSVNDNFSSKLNRINIQTVKSKRESEPERKKTRQKVEEGRKNEIEVA